MGRCSLVATAAQAVAYADQSGDAFQRAAYRTYADALLQSGVGNHHALRLRRCSGGAARTAIAPIRYRVPILRSRSPRVGPSRWRRLKGATPVLDRSEGPIEHGLDTLSLAARTSPRCWRGIQLGSAVSIPTPPSTACAQQVRPVPVLGLLARAAHHRDDGNDRRAAGDLTEAFEMPSARYAAVPRRCWLESARQRLAESNASGGR